MAKTTVTNSSSIRWNPDDRKVLSQIRKLTGITSDADIVRQALRVHYNELLKQQVTAK